MLKGKELIVATKIFAKEDRKLSWFHLITTIMVWLGAIVAAIFLREIWWLALPASVLVALTNVRLFTIYHDYLHKSILQHNLIAKGVFTIYGLYNLTPVSIWKRSHDYHHKHNSKLYTSSIGSFPIVTRKKFLAASIGERRTYLFIRHPLTILFGYIFAFVYGMCIRSLMSSPKKHLDSVLSLIFHFGIAGLIGLFFGGWAVLWAFLIPFWISHALGAYLFYAQHNFPDATFKEKDGWSYIGAALHSSSYMKMNRVMEWFTGNIGYHHIHHVNARIPFYRLPEAYAHFPELQQVGITSLHPADIARCLRLKVWDPEQNRMVGLAELRST